MFINGWIIVILVSLALRYSMIKNDIKISRLKSIVILVLTLFFGIIGSAVWGMFILEELSYKKKAGN